MRYGLVIDLSRCGGCNSCTIACRQKNGTPPGILWKRVVNDEQGEYPTARLQFHHVQCMHCKEPPCVDVCPTGASQKLVNGIVNIDQSKCVGCRACIVACPYNARSFNDNKRREYYPGKGFTIWEEKRPREHIVGTVGKCDFCIDRLEVGMEPKCVHTCPAKALTFGDLDD